MSFYFFKLPILLRIKEIFIEYAKHLSRLKQQT